MFKRKVLLIFSILAVTLYIIEVFLTIDFADSLLIIILQLDLFLFLILWHLGLGLVAPFLMQSKLKNRENASEWDFDDPSSEQSIGYFPLWVRLGFPVLAMTEILGLMFLMNEQLTVQAYLTLILYVVGPSVILLRKSYLTSFFAILWVWFPIEWGVIDDTLGNLTLSLIPLDALIGIFSLLWPMYVYGNHLSWYDWDLNQEDLKVTGLTSLWLTLAIVPLGIITNFLTINPSNFLEPSIELTASAIGNIIISFLLTFYLIFIVQGLMEETLFRDVIFKHQYYWVKNRWKMRFGPLDLGHIMILLGGLLILSIPFWDDVMSFLSSFLPFLDPVADIIGSLALPLGDYEGQSITFIEGLPLWPYYLLVSVLLIAFSLIIYSKHRSPMIAALLLSSMIFGFAHFQDFRYVFFASIAGFGYGWTYYKTKNLVPAAMVHMGVDAVWSLLLQY